MFEKGTDTVQLTDPMLYDRLRTLSAEYDLSVESLVNTAVMRLVNDIDFVRSLRSLVQEEPEEDIQGHRQS